LIFFIRMAKPTLAIIEITKMMINCIKKLPTPHKLITSFAVKNNAH
jgi:hypothetical protein